ncbi:NAD(P)-binding protein [Tothia fuscella]|uniref:NAD(P)-binding protein n=1 Tax=Tothia fuscella TaxID=1048955 RepID=A0A9P4NE97_9PEZI|nr:NAD(P)-binding protein [Tothia fuscella]
MTTSTPPKVFIVGGTGAQGRPTIHSLVKDNAYAVRVLTRDTKASHAQSLKELGDHVELMEGTFADEATLHAGFRGCTYAFVNIDGFKTGEKTELFWAIRAYEIAIEEGIKFFVYGNVDYAYKKGGYDPKYRCGHYDGKGRIGEWILQQTKDNGGEMGAALFTTEPYLEMSIADMTIMTPTVKDGVVAWRLPLGEGAVPHVALEDCDVYVRWLLDKQDRANGMDLEVAIDHIHYADFAKAFEKLTGHPAKYVDTSLEEYWATGPLARVADRPCGYNSKGEAGSLTIRENFTGFWNVWKYSGGNKGVVRRDYGLLDEIHPERIRSAEEWLGREQDRGLNAGLGNLWNRVNNLKPVLKGTEDMLSGKTGKL